MQLQGMIYLCLCHTLGKPLHIEINSTISCLGYSDYSQWFVGHSDSTEEELEKAELFKK